jgi:protein-disulfide isomerase
VSRAHNARRKARRQQARAAADPQDHESPKGSPRSVLFPVLAVVAILIATAILGLGASSSPSRKRVDQEVTALLAGIPQHGVTLGSSDAPVTLLMFADLECPTVKRFVESYLPSMIGDWVRNDIVKLEYRSLKTDTVDERIFFRQEEAALAAGRQNKMWNFVLTFVGQQGQRYTDYANDVFLTNIASQVPGLNMDRWNRDREDVSFFKLIASGIGSAHAHGLGDTPSFVMIDSARRSSTQDEVKIALERALQSLSTEVSTDVPVFKVS